MGKLNEAAVEQIRGICDRYREERTPLMMILSDIQTNTGIFRWRCRKSFQRRQGYRWQRFMGWLHFILSFP